MTGPRASPCPAPRTPRTAERRFLLTPDIPLRHLRNPGSWIGEARKARQGVLLQPQSLNEGDLAGARIPIEIVRRPLRVGRGYVVHPTTGTSIAVALPLTELKG